MDCALRVPPRPLEIAKQLVLSSPSHSYQLLLTQETATNAQVTHMSLGNQSSNRDKATSFSCTLILVRPSLGPNALMCKFPVADGADYQSRGPLRGTWDKPPGRREMWEKPARPPRRGGAFKTEGTRDTGSECCREGRRLLRAGQRAVRERK